MKDKLPEFADNTHASGWLELVSAGAGFSVDHRVPGSSYQYKCSDGYYLSDKSNPEQTLHCEGTRAVDTSAIQNCIREYDTSYAITIAIRILPKNCSNIFYRLTNDHRRIKSNL